MGARVAETVVTVVALQAALGLDLENQLKKKVEQVF